MPIEWIEKTPNACMSRCRRFMTLRGSDGVRLTSEYVLFYCSGGRVCSIADRGLDEVREVAELLLAEDERQTDLLRQKLAEPRSKHLARLLRDWWGLETLPRVSRANYYGAYVRALGRA